MGGVGGVFGDSPAVADIPAENVGESLLNAGEQVDRGAVCCIGQADRGCWGSQWSVKTFSKLMVSSRAWWGCPRLDLSRRVPDTKLFNQVLRETH